MALWHPPKRYINHEVRTKMLGRDGFLESGMGSFKEIGRKTDLIIEKLKLGKVVKNGEKGREKLFLSHPSHFPAFQFPFPSKVNTNFSAIFLHVRPKA